MSRLAFREAVGARRPRSSVVMSAVAAITLTITGQVAPWALLLATLALIVAILERFDAVAWRRSAFLLNTGLLASIAVTLARWLQGELVLIALAEFALLAGSLQLLDTRPRKTEFLLVALAVFQVILAANLTDSVFYPPLLVAFTVSVAWTLIVHTLRAEALEAGEPAAAARVITSGLRRTAITASVAAVLLAMLLFPILPRIRSGSLFAGGLGSPVATSGFSDQVEIGDIGRIRFDPTVVLRVEPQEGELPDDAGRYWRGLAFDHFDGRRWSVTPPKRDRIGGDAEVGVELPGGGEPGGRVVQRIAREEIESGVLFTPGRARALRGPVGRLEHDANQSLYAFSTAGERVDYWIVGRPPPDAIAPSDGWATRDGDDARFIQLPPLRAAVRELAESLTEAASSDLERTRAIERYLQREGRYTDRPPVVPRDGPETPVERFLLGGTEGHCEYFATGMVVLLRSIGAPARLVNGFAGGHLNRVGGFVEVSQSDAHAWVEVHFEEAGWVRFDPTPADLRLAGANELRDSAGWQDLASALELWWFRNVVDFDRGRQARALKDLWLAWRDWRGERGGDGPRAEETLADADDGGFAPRIDARETFALAIAVSVLLFVWRRRGVRTKRTEVPQAYRRALSLVARRGIVRAESQTARDHAARVREELPEDGARAFDAITEAYLAWRFGARPLPDELDGQLTALRDSLRA